MNRLMIKCPKCNGKTKTAEMAWSENDEILRQKKCIECGHIFYTTEFEVEASNHFLREWHGCLAKTSKENKDDRTN